MVFVPGPGQYFLTCDLLVAQAHVARPTEWDFHLHAVDRNLLTARKICHSFVVTQQSSKTLGGNIGFLIA
jgi:hypothetical protein